MKKALTLILAAALIASMCACAKTEKTEAQKEAESMAAELGLETDKDGNYVDEYGNIIFDKDGNEISDNAVYEEDLIEEAKVISEGGVEKGLWPTDEMPRSVPAFDSYSTMYAINYQKSDNDEIWLLGFDTDKEGYEAYLQALQDNGFKKSGKIAGFWGNGEVILDIQTEDNGDGTFYLSIDIYKSAPVEFPDTLKDKYPTFEPSDSTLYYWAEKNDKLTVAYACGDNFENDLAKYKEKLTSDGFTVTDTYAEKEQDGKTYVVEYATSEYEDSFTYYCNG